MRSSFWANVALWRVSSDLRRRTWENRNHRRSCQIRALSRVPAYRDQLYRCVPDLPNGGFSDCFGERTCTFFAKGQYRSKKIPLVFQAKNRLRIVGNFDHPHHRFPIFDITRLLLLPAFWVQLPGASGFFTIFTERSRSFPNVA